MTPLALVTPSPSPLTHVARVDGALVVFNAADRRLHVLNDSAAAVWERLSSPTTIGHLIDDIAASFSADPNTIRGDVERIIDRFVGDGLVGEPSDRPVRYPSPTTAPKTPAGRSFTALDATVRIHTSDPEVADWLDQVVAPLRRSDESIATDAWISVDDRGDGTWVVASSLGVDVTVGSRVGGVLRAVSEINNVAVASTPDHAVFHAGAVALGEKSVVLPGASNRGKSTLTTALVEAGFSYLTDEAAAVDTNQRVRAFPKSIALDPGSFGLFPDLAPSGHGELAARVVRREWHLDPTSFGTVGTGADVSAIVCPHWRAGAATRLNRVSGTEALHTLLGESFDFADGGADVFSLLAALANDVPVYRLGYGDLDEAVATIYWLLA